MFGTSSASAGATARFSVSLEGIPLIEKVAECKTPERSPHHCETEDKGTESITLYRTTTTTEYLYNIRVYAGADAAPAVDLVFGSADSGALAAVDPFLYIDPTWEYAQYFVVQQESTLNPGEWADVTREWQATTVVPAPPGLGFLATGVVGLGGRRLMRRFLLLIGLLLVIGVMVTRVALWAMHNRNRSRSRQARCALAALRFFLT